MGIRRIIETKIDRLKEQASNDAIQRTTENVTSLAWALKDTRNCVSDQDRADEINKLYAWPGELPRPALIDALVQTGHLASSFQTRAARILDIINAPPQPISFVAVPSVFSFKPRKV